MKKECRNTAALFLLGSAMMVLLHGACMQRHEQTIDAGWLKRIFVKEHEYKPGAVNRTFTCSSDTLRQNVEMSFAQLCTYIQKSNAETGELQTSRATQHYIMALKLAEFVYAAFSIQFLHMPGSQPYIQNWNSYPLERCYNTGNTNTRAIWCGDRTDFYIRLLDTLTGIKARSISIENRHTFPVVAIAGKEYVVDPFDPFIAFDSSEKHVLSYGEMLNNPRLHYSVKRSARAFGQRKELVSAGLYTILENQVHAGNSVCEKIKAYFGSMKSYPIPCSSESFSFDRTVYPIPGKINCFAIVFNQLGAPVKMSRERFNSFYMGRDCRAAETRNR